MRQALASTGAPAADPAATPPTGDPTGAPPKAQDPNALPPGTTPEQVWKRYRDQQSYHDRERAAQQQRYAAIERQVQQLQSQARTAEQAKTLPRWDARHPQTQEFSNLLNRAETVRQQLANVQVPPAPEGMAPEHAQAWRESFTKAARQSIVSALSPDEHKELESYNRSVQDFQRNLQVNPQQALAPVVQPMIQQEIQRYVRDEMAKQQVDQDWDDPKLGPHLRRFQPQIAKAMEEMGRDPYKYAKHYTQVYAGYEEAIAEVERLRGELESKQAKVDTAESVTRLARGKASITRDLTQAASGPKNIFGEAKALAAKEGQGTATPRFRQLVRELQAKYGRAN